jgi:putative transposase
VTQYQLTVGSETVQRLFSGDGQLGRLVEAVLNQVLNAQVSEQLQAAPYERSDQRQGYRNGYKPRQLTTRVGTLTLQVPQVPQVPQVREGQFSTELFARYQRSEQALVLTLMEMVVNGVSTRKVARITEELCGTSFAKSTVSDLCKALDPVVSAWNERDLSVQRFPFVLVDALVVKVREEGRVRAVSALVATGVNERGYREILGLRVGDSESERTWQDFFTWLKGRGLNGVDLVVSDHHGGLVKAVQVQFQGATWQRCQTHLSANIADATPKALQEEVHARLRPIFARPTRPLPAPCWRASWRITRPRRPQRWQPWNAALTTRRRCWRCPPPTVCGYGPPMAWSASMRRFVAASASFASFPTATRWSVSSGRCSWNRMRSGRPASATST